MTTVESRVGALEGRADEQAAAITDLRADIRDLGNRLDQGLNQVNVRIDQVNARIDLGLNQVNGRIGHELSQVNARIDRLFVAMLTVGVGLGVAQVGVLVTIVLRT